MDKEYERIKMVRQNTKDYEECLEEKETIKKGLE